jgi:hypothetical protein
LIAGVVLVPGLSAHERRFSTRASAEELWAALDVASSPSGRAALWAARGLAEDTRALRRFSAYLSQARSFYFASAGIDVLSRPLASYYSVLNLAKAWLTLSDPSITDPTPPPPIKGKQPLKRKKLRHGTSDELDASKQRYYFSQERLAFQPDGVFSEIAKRSGPGFSYAQKKEVSVAELAPYLCETHDEYESAIQLRPRLIPLQSLEVWRGKTPGPGGKGELGALWLRAEVAAGTLTARNISPANLLKSAHHFGACFNHVSSPHQDLHSYETGPLPYKGRNPNPVLPDLVGLFERSLIHVNRSAGSHRYFLVLDKRRNLLSQEAVSFAVLHHLSEMVRYRPEQVERLAGERWSWLLGTWIPRALENSLLTYATRILDRELRIYS